MFGHERAAEKRDANRKKGQNLHTSQRKTQNVNRGVTRVARKVSTTPDK